jgi:large subunit ribosomal protein L6
MTVAGKVEETIEVPSGIKASVQGYVVTISAKGIKQSRRLWHPRVQLAVSGNHITISSEMPSRREKALVGTFSAHIKNMIVGVTDGFRCEMKMVYSHFPMKLIVKDREFVIENFLGEKFPRKARIMGETQVEVKGDQVILTGHSIEDVGQSAANIERATKIKNFDPRVFQDGVYIVVKPGEVP